MLTLHGDLILKRTDCSYRSRAMPSSFLVFLDVVSASGILPGAEVLYSFGIREDFRGTIASKFFSKT